MNNIIGSIATIASLTVVFIGLPAQIFKNYKMKNTEGLADSLVYAACFTYTLWSLYGWTKPDLFIIIAQTPGTILAFILLFQVFYYKRKGGRR